MTTTGYGDEVPTTLLGMVFAIFAMCFGILLIALARRPSWAPNSRKRSRRWRRTRAGSGKRPWRSALAVGGERHLRELRLGKHPDRLRSHVAETPRHCQSRHVHVAQPHSGHTPLKHTAAVRNDARLLIGAVGFLIV